MAGQGGKPPIGKERMPVSGRDRGKHSLCPGVEKVPCFFTTQKVKNLPTWGFLTYSPVNQAILFKSYFSANFLELSLHALCFGLSEAFLHGVGSAVNELFSFLQAEAGEFLNELNDFEFFCTSSLENYVERGLFFNSGSACGGAGCYSYSGSCGFDTVFFLEDLGEFVNFLYGEVYELFSKSF